MDYMKKMKEFHREFNWTLNEVPTLISSKDALGRIRLIQEEFSEFTEAVDKEDIVEIADALGDLLYVVFGTAVAYGLPMDTIFELIHNSNMSKIGGHHEGGKHIKPSTYTPVDLTWLRKNWEKNNG